ncbi:MAG TPA: MFS transporter [Candidatus Scubalenecus merdavium]|uniref:MFS transporter n=1 Tax=Candidatus Scybalenecus merdavium TaxID=2840939 RepID=A0A9D1SNL9_9FIRM|nr:MFS transporter [Candidatus Scubalenecus merdavium]
MGKLKTFLDSKIIKTDVGEETYLTWRETLSYAAGRGAQGMNTSMTSSKYINFFLTNVLFRKLEDPMGVASKIRLFCGIFDAINDPIMGVLVDKTRTKDGQMRPYIKWAPIFVSIVMVLFFIGSADAPPLLNIIYTTILFIGLDVTYTAFDIPMGALAFSITPSGIERTKLFGVSSITRSVLGALPQVFVAGAALLPYFNDHTPQAYLTSAIVSAIGIIFLTRFTFKNTRERAEHREDVPSVKECFALLFKNRPLLMLFLGNIFFVICKIAEQVSFYFVADLMFNRSYNVFIDVVKFPGFLVAGLLVPKIVERLGRRADSKKFYQACCVAAILLHGLFALTCYNGLMNKPEGESVGLFTGILVVLFTGMTAIPLEFKNLIQKEMEAETVDYIEWKSGTRVEGIMLSIMSFTGKIENTLSSSIGLAVLGFTGYIQHTEGSLAQNTETNWALFLLTTLVPAIGYLLMLVPMHFYNITGDGHRKMMKEIMARRAARKADGEQAPAETAE